MELLKPKQIHQEATRAYRYVQNAIYFLIGVLITIGILLASYIDTITKIAQ